MNWTPHNMPAKDVEQAAMIMVPGDITQSFFKIAPVPGQDPGYVRFVSLKTGEMIGLLGSVEVTFIGKFSSGA